MGNSESGVGAEADIGYQRGPVYNRPRPVIPNHPLALTSPCAIVEGYGLDPNRLRRIKNIEYKDAAMGWITINITPCYVRSTTLGVCIADHARIVDGKWYYSVYKLYPFNPIRNKNILERYEVPFNVRGTQIIYAMKYAISEIWPTRDLVIITECGGNDFQEKLSNMNKIIDKDITIAINAIKNDYPGQAFLLSKTRSRAPQFEYREEKYSYGYDRTQEQFVTLRNSEEEERAFRDLQGRYNNSKTGINGESQVNSGEVSSLGILPDLNSTSSAEFSLSSNGTTSTL